MADPHRGVVHRDRSSEPQLLQSSRRVETKAAVRPDVADVSSVAEVVTNAKWIDKGKKSLEEVEVSHRMSE